jgi:hypothetical protein
MMVPTCSSSSQCTLQIIFTSFSSSQCVPQDVPNGIALYPIIFAPKWNITFELWAKEKLYTSIAQCSQNNHNWILIVAPLKKKKKKKAPSPPNNLIPWSITIDTNEFH